MFCLGSAHRDVKAKVLKKVTYHTVIISNNTTHLGIHGAKQATSVY